MEDGTMILPYARGAETSKAAADSVRGIATALAMQVLRYIAERGADGATCDEFEAASGMKHQTASARFWELRRKGLIKATGARRRTRSGRMADAWGKA